MTGTDTERPWPPTWEKVSREDYERLVSLLNHFTEGGQTVTVGRKWLEDLEWGRDEALRQRADAYAERDKMAYDELNRTGLAKERVRIAEEALVESERHREINLREAILWKQGFDELQTRTKEVEMALRSYGTTATELLGLAREEHDTEMIALQLGKIRAYVQAISLITGEWDTIGGEFAAPTLEGDFVRRDGTHGETYVLGRCPHGVDLDAAICPDGCRV